MAIDATAPFIWGANGSQLTPAQAEAQRKVAQALMTNGMDYSPVKSAWQGAARMAQAALGGFESGQADASDKATAAMQPKLLADAIAASQGGSPAAPVIGSPSGPGDTAVPPAGATAIPAGKDEFVSSVMPLAQEASAKTGLDPRLIVAQAALESGYGQHAPGNNLFGIKSHGQPGGNVLPTTEVVNGQPVQTSDSFRAYASPADSVSGYADFINANPRYAPVKAAQGLEGQAAALGQSGYATDPNYGSKVLQIARALPAPTDGVLAANSPSPLDNAQYPAGPVGAPTQAVADEGEADTPVNAQPTQGALPTAQAVQAATQPQSAVAKIAPLISAMNNPYASESTKKIAAVLLTSALSQENKAPISVAKGSTLINPRTGQVVYKAPDEEDKPKFGVIGEDQMGRKQYGWTNPSKQSVTPSTPPQAPANELDPNVHGEEFLAQIQKSDPGMASQVRAVVEGRAPYPTGMLLKTPYGQRMAQLVTQADPTFESGNPAARTKMQADLSTGTLGKNNNALNTAIGHLGHLSEAAQALDNGSWTSINSVKNWFSTQSGDPKVTNFNTIRDKVAEEFTKVYRGSGGAEADVEREIKNMNAANSPAQLHGAIAKMAELAQSKIDANEAQYKGAMGPMARYAPMVLPKTQQVLEKLKALAEGKPPTSTASGNTTKSGISWSVE